jgi:redox-sensitive bicupin YhaK (pirin superfamily)
MKSLPRHIERIIEPQPVVEGAGVKLKRSIGTQTLDYLDPFLLLDHFSSTDRRDYEAGFPLHPHRGIETVTYMLSGRVTHKDTLGNAGTIGPGDVQWMTAGRGIMHEEMPQVRPEGIAGFQLWVNLPAKLKMTAPRYQNILSAEVPEINKGDGARVGLITGEVEGTAGPVSGIAANPIYMDVNVPPHSRFKQTIDSSNAAFAYVFQGAARFSAADGTEKTIQSPKLVVLSAGDYVEVATADEATRFLLVSGRPLGEPVARYGPFVMNSRQEIEQALEDLRHGTFV